MAEEESGQERTEQATPKRLEKARGEGQVARSRELGTTLLLMTGGVALLLMGKAITEKMVGLMTFNLNFDRAAATDPAAMFSYIEHSISSVIWLVSILLFLLLVAGIIGAIGLSGWILSVKPLTPRLSRLNPLEGLKRMFSMKALVELFKALAKFLLVATVAVIVLLLMQDNLLALSSQGLWPASVSATRIVLLSALMMSAATLLIAFIDVPYQIYDHAKKLRMTRQQIKDEFKDSEGKPEVKSRIRQLQREFAQSRMMSAIPDADVIITNPEHFSVALKYQLEGNSAPKVVAKGSDQIALKIREIANHYEIPQIRSPLLTRAVFYTTDIDQEIPEKLYLAVAQVLAFIFQLRKRNNKKPTANQVSRLNREISVPTEYQFDEEGCLLET